jgi:hypothetical protein
VQIGDAHAYMTRTSYTPDAAKIDKFLEKIKPIVAYVLANNNAALDRAKKRMRPYA